MRSRQKTLQQSNQILIKSALFPWQREVLTNMQRFTVVAAGRRVGKTTLATVLALKYAAEQGKRVWWIAPSYPQATVSWRILYSALSALSDDVVTIRKVERTFYFPQTDGFIRVRSADKEHLLRSEGLDFVVLDEAAYLKEALWTAVIRPALADRQGKALFISTPNGQNWFYNLFYLAKSMPDWYAATYTTYANPNITEEEIENSRRLLPESIFRQEFLAEFVADDNVVFRYVDDAVDTTLARRSDSSIIIACDIATEVDYTAIAIFDKTQNALLALDRFHRVDYPTLVARIDAVCSRWNPDAIIIERNGVGQAVFDYLAQRQQRVIAFTTTNQTKQQMIVALQTAFEKRNIKLFRHEQLLNELKVFTSSRSASGTMTYSAPPGHHDDCVIALAMAHWHAQKSAYAAVMGIVR